MYYALAVRNGNQPILTGMTKGGSTHWNKPVQQSTINKQPAGNFEEILTALHRSVLDIQKDFKEIKIDLEGFKARMLEVKQTVESITNPGLNFKARPLT